MVLFEERQHFRQWWLNLLNVVLLLVAAYTAYTLMTVGGDWTALAISGSLVFTVVWISLISLKTKITRDTISVGFTPLDRRTIRREDIASAYIRTYDPLTEYGGWGYRNGFSAGRAYNTMGNLGLQLELTEGKKLLIGTQQPARLGQVMEDWMKYV